MAEVFRALDPGEEGVFMPNDEMLKPQRDEVYEAAGDHLMMIYELTGELESHGDFLIHLNDGRWVAFSYGGHIAIETSD